MTIPFLERWTDPGLAIGDDPDELADWSKAGGSTGTWTVQETPAFDGTERSARHVSTTSDSALQQSWAATATVYASFYTRFTSLTGSGNMYIAGILGTTLTAQLRRNSAGNLVLRNNNTAVATSTFVYNVDTWIRIDWRVSTATSNMEVRIFHGANLHGTTPDETLSGAYGQGNPTMLKLGPYVNADGLTMTQFYSHVQASSVTWPTPYSSGATPLDTPTGLTATVTPGTRTVTFNWVAVPNVVQYRLDVDYLSGTNPSEEADWTALGSFTVAAGTTTLVIDDSPAGITWNEDYRVTITAEA